MFNVVFRNKNGSASTKLDVSTLLDGSGLYNASTQVASKIFTNEFANIINGDFMFVASNIASFNGSLKSLIKGTAMFSGCKKLVSFDTSLDNLASANNMFNNTPLLTSFSSFLPNLRLARWMFQNATALPSFSVSLPKLTDGRNMFDGCASLETFNSVLPSLEVGSYMFQGCKLSGRSVRNIVESLPTYETQHSITIGINCTEDIEGQREFLRETGYNTFEEIENALAAKGWKVVWHFQGFPSGWRPVEYLESTGTQWIDTGIKLSSESEVKCDYELITETPDTNQYLFGAQTTVNNIFMQFGYVTYAKNSPNRIYGYVKTDSSVNNNLARPENGKISVILNKEGLELNETFSSPSVIAENFELPINCYLFADNSYNHEGLFFYGRVYNFSISRAGSFQLDLVPCVDSLGNPCMYDRVSKTSLYNQTDTKFLVPTTSATYSLRQPVAEFAQLTNSGVRKLYHLPYDYEGTLEEFVKENGFKQLVENEKPEEGNWMPEWTETEDAIVLNWVEAPEEIVEV